MTQLHNFDGERATVTIKGKARTFQTFKVILEDGQEYVFRHCLVREIRTVAQATTSMDDMDSAADIIDLMLPIIKSFMVSPNPKEVELETELTSVQMGTLIAAINAQQGFDFTPIDPADTEEQPPEED